MQNAVKKQIINRCHHEELVRIECNHLSCEPIFQVCSRKKTVILVQSFGPTIECICIVCVDWTISRGSNCRLFENNQHLRD